MPLASAQTLKPPVTPRASGSPRRMRCRRRSAAMSLRNIDFLFDALKAAPDDDSAKAIENRIWALWLTSGSDTADLLMTRVKRASDAKNTDLAIRCSTHHRDSAVVHRSLEPPRHAVFPAQGLQQRAGRYPSGPVARAAPLRALAGLGTIMGRDRRGKTGAGGVPPRPGAAPPAQASPIRSRR